MGIVFVQAKETPHLSPGAQEKAQSFHSPLASPPSASPCCRSFLCALHFLPSRRSQAPERKAPTPDQPSLARSSGSTPSFWADHEKASRHYCWNKPPYLAVRHLPGLLLHLLLFLLEPELGFYFVCSNSEARKPLNGAPEG